MKKFLDLFLPSRKRSRQLTNVELMGYRYFFRLDVKVMADLAGCTPKTWYAWENGDSPVPAKVCDMMDGLQMTYIDELASAEILLREQGRGERCALRFYETLELFMSHYPTRDYLAWRMGQSVALRLFSEQQVYLVSAEKIEGEICGE
jgi:hypothetical protein